MKSDIARPRIFFALKKGEVDELIILLEEIKFKFIFIDKNGIKAIKEGNRREVYWARKKLEKEGLSWSEKSKEPSLITLERF